MTRNQPSQDEDPRPVPPVRPDRDDCCNSSCNPCIFDLYDAAVDRYRAELRSWEERQPRAKEGGR